MPNPVSQYVFREVARPRPAFLLGPKGVLDRIPTLRQLPHGTPTTISWTRFGQIGVQRMEIDGEAVFEVELASAVDLIQQLGLKLGEEGLAVDFTDGA